MLENRQTRLILSNLLSDPLSDVQNTDCQRSKTRKYTNKTEDGTTSQNFSEMHGRFCSGTQKTKVYLFKRVVQNNRVELAKYIAKCIYWATGPLYSKDQHWHCNKELTKLDTRSTSICYMGYKNKKVCGCS